MKHSQDKNKVKKKVGKMKVSCEKCGSGISNLTETRQQFRLKLRGFCESCNKFKVAYIVDHKAIAESGKRFDFIVKENLPATAQPLPPNSNTQAQKPANPASKQHRLRHQRQHLQHQRLNQPRQATHCKQQSILTQVKRLQVC